MEYNKLNLKNGDIFSENHLSHLENGIFNNTNQLNGALSQIRALQTDNSNMNSSLNGLLMRVSDWDDILETLLIPLQFSEEEFGYMFGANLKETLNPGDVDYLYLLGMTGSPLKVIIGGSDSPGSYHSVYNMLYFIPTVCEYVPYQSEDGSQISTRLKGSFQCDYEGMTFYVTIEEQLDSEYTIEFSYKVNATVENTYTNISMGEYTELFTLGGTITSDNNAAIFEVIKIAINNNAPFYINKWKEISETETIMNPLKFELQQIKYTAEREPLKYIFTNTQIAPGDDNKIIAGAHTLTYDVINETLTGGVLVSQ